MKWISNTRNMVMKANKRLWILRRLKNMGALENDLLEVYIKQIRCILEYAVPAWAPWLEKDSNILEKVQERALKQITCLNHLTYPEKLQKLGMMSVKDRRTKADLCQVWKIIHKHDDVDESTWFTRANVVNLRQTRQNSSQFNLAEPLANRDTRRQFFSIRVVKPWNNLPEHVKSARTIGSFKKLYDKHLMAATNAQ